MKNCSENPNNHQPTHYAESAFCVHPEHANSVLGNWLHPCWTWYTILQNHHWRSQCPWLTNLVLLLIIIVNSTFFPLSKKVESTCASRKFPDFSEWSSTRLLLLPTKCRPGVDYWKTLHLWFFNPCPRLSSSHQTST